MVEEGRLKDTLREGLGCAVGLMLSVGSLTAGGVVIFGVADLLVDGANSGVRLLLMLFALWMVFASLTAAAMTYRRLMQRWFGEGAQDEAIQYHHAPLRDVERVLSSQRTAGQTQDARD